MAIWNRRPGRLPAPPPPPARPVEAAPPEFLAPPPALRALLNKDSEVSGKLTFSGPTRIDGRLRGEVRGSDLLVIGESGYVRGTVRATRLIVLGCVEGDVLGAEHVEIGPQGALTGRVETRALEVRQGGVLEGDVKVAAPRATVVPLRPPAEG
ncbi:MAG: polymer-forming cytoskeletal protein [Deltaproteobacteria bacterium]|nr:polymer-forming cytoskeletal protein [Deltaproteobacteria bacterium]